MSSNGSKPLQFKAPVGVPVIGQPFTIVSIGVPVNAVLRCNCGGDDATVTILGSVGAACPSCRKVYSVLFNPTNGQLQVHVGVPSAEEAKVSS